MSRNTQRMKQPCTAYDTVSKIAVAATISSFYVCSQQVIVLRDALVRFSILFNGWYLVCGGRNFEAVLDDIASTVKYKKRHPYNPNTRTEY